MCDANSYIEGTIIQAEIDPNGYFWLSEGSGQSRYFKKYGSTNRAYPQEGCVNCPTPVPPTSTPVPPTSTPVPPTSTPVPDPTSTPAPDPTSTPVPDPTPTSGTSYSYRLGPSYTLASQACDNFGTDFYTDVFAATNVIYEVQQFFTDSGLTAPYYGENETHAFQLSDGVNLIGSVYSGTISYSGLVSNLAFCSVQP
jgi:hypothetical protein